jgi:hypothetical protein
LGPLEHPSEHGISRVDVLRLVEQHYKAGYEEVFGPWPMELDSSLLAQPALPRPKFSLLNPTLGAYLLASLDSFSVMNQVLTQAKIQGIPAYQAAVDLARQGPVSHPEVWYQRWEAMSPNQRALIDQTFAKVGTFLAAFELSIPVMPSAFDRFAQRKVFDESFAEAEWEGMALFTGKAGCVLCHNGPDFRDNGFHNIALASTDGGRAFGINDGLASKFRCLVDSQACQEWDYIDQDSMEAVGAFKTPSLRFLGKQQYFGHQGQFSSLEQVIDHYNNPPLAAIGHREETLNPLKLSKLEKAQLKAFLISLYTPVALERLAVSD